MIDLLRLCRLYYALPMSLACALTVYYARGGQMAGQWAGLIMSTAALALVIAAGYVVNDVVDVRADRINSPGRPVAAGRVRRAAALAWGLLLLIGGLALAVLCRPMFLVTLSAVAAGLMAYDLTSKRLGPGKQVAVAALMTSIYPLALAQAGGAMGSRAWTLAVFPAWMFLTSLGYETLKDIRDLAGDRALAPRPTPLQRNPTRWRQLANLAVLAGAALLVGPALLGCRWVYMLLAALAMATAVCAALVPIRWAIRCIYLECVLVGVAATADIIIFGP